jgi:hypothetical protein
VHLITNQPKKNMSIHIQKLPQPTAHSPGPWNISKHATPEHSPQFGVYAGDSLNDLATVKGNDAAANARLIAAAPALLAALEALRRETEKLANYFDVDGDGFAGTAPIWAFLADANDAAILARGEAAQ